MNNSRGFQLYLIAIILIIANAGFAQLKVAKVISQSWSPDGRWFAYITFNKGQRLLTVRDIRAQINLLQVASNYDPQFSSDSRFLLLPCEKDKYEVWNLKTGKVKEILDMHKCQLLDGRNLMLSLSKIGVLAYSHLGSAKKQIISIQVNSYMVTIDGAIYYICADSLRKQEEIQKYDIQSGQKSILFSSANKLSGMYYDPQCKTLLFRDGLPGSDEATICILHIGCKPNRIVQDAVKGLPKGAQMAVYSLWHYDNPGNLLVSVILEKKQISPVKKDTVNRMVWNSDDWGMSMKQLSFSGMPESKPEKRILRIYNFLTREVKPLLAYEDNYFNPQLIYPGIGNYIIYFDDAKYQDVVSNFYKDVWLLDVRTGEKRVLIDKFSMYDGRSGPLSSFLAFSPDGKYVCYYLNKNYWLYDTSTKVHRNLTKDINAQFVDPVNDMQVVAKVSGPIVWDKDSKSVYLPSANDIYQFNSGSPAFVKLTDGKEKDRVYRLAVTNGVVDSSKPLILETKETSSRYTGWFSLHKGSLQPIVYQNAKLTKLTMSENGKSYSYISEKYNMPSQLIMAAYGKVDTIFDSAPGYQQYHMDKSELVSYVLKDGTKLNGALYYPANYDPTKSYPMLVNIYERLSQNVHNFPGFSTPFYLDLFAYNQHGYFVFQPDIKFRLGDPGVSAAECVVAAVKASFKNNSIDSAHVGLIGHSWGGYEAGFIISQTNLFKAAIAGAALSDLTSMYLSNRWDTNQASSSYVLFEQHQARMKGPYYDYSEDYIRNSTIYQVKNIHTPLLIEVGNKDGTVDPTQGMELFNALRRLGKPATLVVYDKEGHLLSKPENIKDYATKQSEFFDYYLKGATKPEWLN